MTLLAKTLGWRFCRRRTRGDWKVETSVQIRRMQSSEYIQNISIVSLAYASSVCKQTIWHFCSAGVETMSSKVSWRDLFSRRDALCVPTLNAVVFYPSAQLHCKKMIDSCISTLWLKLWLQWENKTWNVEPKMKIVLTGLLNASISTAMPAFKLSPVKIFIVVSFRFELWTVLCFQQSFDF